MQIGSAVETYMLCIPIHDVGMMTISKYSFRMSALPVWILNARRNVQRYWIGYILCVYPSADGATPASDRQISLSLY